VRFYFTGTEILYDYNANLSKAVAAKRLPLTILCTHLSIKPFTRYTQLAETNRNIFIYHKILLSS